RQQHRLSPWLLAFQRYGTNGSSVCPPGIHFTRARGRAKRKSGGRVRSTEYGGRKAMTRLSRPRTQCVFSALRRRRGKKPRGELLGTPGIMLVQHPRGSEYLTPGLDANHPQL